MQDIFRPSKKKKVVSSPSSDTQKKGKSQSYKVQSPNLPSKNAPIRQPADPDKKLKSRKKKKKGAASVIKTFSSQQLFEVDPFPDDYVKQEQAEPLSDQNDGPMSLAAVPQKKMKKRKLKATYGKIKAAYPAILYIYISFLRAIRFIYMFNI